MIRHSLGFSSFHIRFISTCNSPTGMVMLIWQVRPRRDVEVNSFVHGFDGILNIRKRWMSVHMLEFLLRCVKCGWKNGEGLRGLFV